MHKSEVASRMYVPSSFAEDDPERLRRFVEQNSFGIFVSQEQGVPAASHLPFLFDWTSGPHGRLIGHVARANPQWKELDGQETLTIFSGPHAYISPAWYQAEEVVPTWNYIAVHVHGRATVIHEADALAKMVGEFVRYYERPRAAPWTLDEHSHYVKKMCQQIVGFHIDITRIQGKWKLGQNHPAARRRLAAAALREQPDENSQAIAAAMERTLSRDGNS
ncbi:MAG TPA: FMN-binding negative transcriptional regulator [Planctomycetaceae bacterium]|nr:FMN-binding negative transcriptional regulator [Planctomycetaceae bacterium]